VADADGFAITGWERVEPIAEPVDWVAIGRAVRRVHSLPVEQVPVGYPVPDPSSFPWWDFDGMLAELSDAIDDAALSGLRAALRRGAGWQRDIARGAVLCHGDVHPGNVLMTVDGPLLIDWDLLCVANPAWDHAMLATYAERWGGDPAVLAGFTAGYGEPAVDRALTARLGELRNVAATLMRVELGRGDPAVAAEAARRLRHWRGDPAAPTWRAQ
jgi:Ser/Thr protein kinase RdoA (MazF antagonist)